MTIKELWTEKYRPKNIDDYVFRDEKLKKQVKSWLKDGAIPHILLSGTQGIGKTTLAKLIFRELGVPREDILELNASHENSVAFMRDNIGAFVSQMPFGEFRYVLLDEADYLSQDAQAVLRGHMERYAPTSRFILTCNYDYKIIPALKSRTQGFYLKELDRGDFDIRAATILASEGVEFDMDTLDTFVKVSYPDLRKCINLLQQNVMDGKLTLPRDEDSSDADYKLEMVNLFKAGKKNEARKLVCAQARPEEFDDIYRFFYQNLDFYGNEQNQEEAILIIRKGLVNHSICADPEINLAATMIELSNITKQ